MYVLYYSTAFNPKVIHITGKVLSFINKNTFNLQFKLFEKYFGILRILIQF